MFQLKACAAEQELEEAQPEYSEGRENIDVKADDISLALGSQLKEESDKFSNEEVKETGVPQPEEFVLPS